MLQSAEFTERLVKHIAEFVVSEEEGQELWDMIERAYG